MNKWHKGSRFWMVGLQALWASWLLVPFVAWIAPAAIEEAIGAFSLISFTLLGGGAASNFQQAKQGPRPEEAT
jgi:hypothetical protein